MSEIFNIEQLRGMAHPIISIPNFDNTGTIKVQVQQPRLMAMAMQGEIPNHLLTVANQMMFGSGNKKKEEVLNIKNMANSMELYCIACLIKPTYEEFKDIITDDQMLAVFNWGMGKVSELDSFRKDEENGTNNNNVKEVPKKA